ncbi:hypothetical protein FB451DRAFT_1409489 [Mycena latifolia]|nr:hypothetical protein FB451DRAFT_1409489 [Mycena latifolia]
MSRVALSRCDSSPFLRRPPNLRATRPLLFSYAHPLSPEIMTGTSDGLALPFKPSQLSALYGYHRRNMCKSPPIFRVLLLWISFLAPPALVYLQTSPNQTSLRQEAPLGYGNSSALSAYITPALAVEFAL